jgi:hypothetical protein
MQREEAVLKKLKLLKPFMGEKAEKIRILCIFLYGKRRMQ